LKISIIGADTLAPQMRAALDVGVGNALEIAGARGMQLVQDNIQSGYLGRPAAVATGELLHSITYNVSRGAGLGTATVFSQPPGGDYASYVETGTGPHFPPIAPLLLWVQKRLGATDEKQATSIAFAIARTIAKRGVSGFGMFARAMQVLSGELQAIFENAIAAAFEAAGLAK
jgi:hypothetical protein